MLQRIQCLLPQFKNYRFVQAIPRFRLPAVREARPPTFGGQPLLVLPTCCTQPILDSNNLRDSMDLQFLEWLGRCLVSDGRYNDAERPYTQVMEMRKRVLREEHPYTLRSVSSRALGLQYQGQVGGGMINRRALDGREKMLGRSIQTPCRASAAWRLCC